MVNKSELISQNLIEVSPLKIDDIEKLDSILKQHVHQRDNNEIVDETEISNIKYYMRGNPDKKGRYRKYFVAKSIDGSVLGCMAYSNMTPGMTAHFRDINFGSTVQLLNAFVDSQVYQGGGVGKKLFKTICNDAKAKGKKYLTVNSGLRYQDSWGFYDKMFDENRGLLINKLNPARNANTWLKKL